MKITDDIISALTGTEPNLKSALLQTKVLSYKMGASDVNRWAHNELAGYPDLNSVPRYRQIGVSVRGTVASGITIHRDLPLPTSKIPPEYQDVILNRRITESVGTLEQWDGHGNQLALPFPHEALGFLQSALTPDACILRANMFFPVGAFRRCLDEITARLLDFILQLDEALPAENSAPDALANVVKELKVSDLFQKAVIKGSVVNIAIGQGNSAVQHSTMTQKNDLKALTDLLVQQGIAASEAAALEQAITDDRLAGEDVTPQFGSKVREWLSSIMLKAGTASCTATIDQIAKYVIPAIAAYYGLP